MFLDADQFVVEVRSEVASKEHPAIWYRAMHRPNLLVACNWDGDETGDLLVGAEGRATVSPSPDGNRLLLWNARSVRRGGVVLGTVPRGDWAGDSRHICSIRRADGTLEAPRWRSTGSFPESSPTAAFDLYSFQPVPAALFLEDVDTGRRWQVAEVGNIHGPPPLASGPHILCCSVPRSVAFVADSRPPVPLRMIHRIDLSSGVTSPLPFEVEGTVEEAVFSSDGTLVAISARPLGAAAGPGRAASHAGLAVYDTSSGSLLSRIAATEPLAFSDGGRLILTADPAGADARLRVLSVIDWSSGHRLWTRRTSYGSWLAKPGSNDLVVADRHWLAFPTEHRSQPVEDLWLIKSDGTATLAVGETSPLTE